MLRIGAYALLVLTLPPATDGLGSNAGGGGESPPPVPTCGADPALVLTINIDGTTLNNASAVFPLYDFMPGWTLGEQQVYLHGHLPPPPARGFFPDQYEPISPGSLIRVTCPCNNENKPCQVTLSQYHCPVCSSRTNGGWPVALPLLGWRPGSSVVLSSTPESAEGWRTLGWRKFVQAGTHEDIPIVGVPLEHVGVFVRQCTADCTQVNPVGGNTPDECSCSSTECWSNWPPEGETFAERTFVPCELAPRCAPTLLDRAVPPP